MISLRRLDIQKNEILDVGLLHVTRLQNLEYLKTSANCVSDTTERCVSHEIRKTRPWMEFIYR